MKVICFWSKLDGRTENAIKAQTSEAIFENTSSDKFAYWRALKSHWALGDDLMVIEHDIGLRGGEIESFSNCDQPWCVYEYPYNVPGLPAQPYTLCLGCTRFSAKIQSKIDLGNDPIHWKVLDTQILRGVRASQLASDMPHIHGSVDHFHFLPLELDIVAPEPVEPCIHIAISRAGVIEHRCKIHPEAGQVPVSHFES